MTIETALLILESSLLVVTIVLLIFSLKEIRSRNALLVEVGKAIKILSRQEYFLTVTDAMKDAKIEVIGSITGRLPVGEDKKRVMDVISNIEHLTGQGVRVSYLMPKFQDRLYLGHLYTKAGAEVRYSNCLMVHSIRFIIVDERLVVLGIPEATGEKEATKKGYRVPSEGLALILKDHFDRCEKQITYEDYLREIIEQSGAPRDVLARELQIDEKEIERVSGR